MAVIAVNWTIFIQAKANKEICKIVLKRHLVNIKRNKMYHDITLKRRNAVIMEPPETHLTLQLK